MEGRLVRRLKTAIGGVVISGAVVVGGPAAAGGAAAVGTVAVAMKAVAQVGQESKNRISCDTAYVQLQLKISLLLAEKKGHGRHAGGFLADTVPH